MSPKSVGTGFAGGGGGGGGGGTTGAATSSANAGMPDAARAAAADVAMPVIAARRESGDSSDALIRTCEAQVRAERGATKADAEPHRARASTAYIIRSEEGAAISRVPFSEEALVCT